MLQNSLADFLAASKFMLSSNFIVLAASLQLRSVLPSPWIYACQSLLWDTIPIDLSEFLFVPSTRYTWFRVDQFTCLLPRVTAIALITPLGLRKLSRYTSSSYRCRTRCFLWSLTHARSPLAPVPLLASGLIAPCFQLRPASLTFWPNVDRSGVITLL
jgi:hypothetical protein